MTATVTQIPAATRALPPITDRRRIPLEARVTSRLKDGLFDLVLDNGFHLRGFLTGEPQIFSKEILPEDRVVVEVSSFDLSHGRIIRHEKRGRAEAVTDSRRPLVVT